MMILWGDRCEWWRIHAALVAFIARAIHGLCDRNILYFVSGKHSAIPQEEVEPTAA